MSSKPVAVMEHSVANGLNLAPSIPLDIQRVFRQLHTYVGQLHGMIRTQQDALDNRIGSDKASKLELAKFMREQLQASGNYPLSVSQLPGAGTSTATTNQTSTAVGSTSVVTGDLTEVTSAILNITGGSEAVVGDGVQLEVKRSSAIQDGYLAATDFVLFSTASRPIVDTHANRATYLAGTLPTGTTYYETDRDAVYLVVAANWKWIAGVMVGADATGKPGSLGLADIGFTYLAQDTQEISIWVGAAWQLITAVWE